MASERNSVGVGDVAAAFCLTVKDDGQRTLSERKLIRAIREWLEVPHRDAKRGVNLAVKFAMIGRHKGRCFLYGSDPQPPAERRLMEVPTPVRAIRRNKLRRIEPAIKPVVRLVIKHSYPATVPVWSCGGHAGGAWRRSGEFGRIAHGRPYVVLGAAKWLDLLGTAMLLLEKRRGPMSLIRVIPKGTMLPRLRRAAPKARVWGMVVFESRRATGPASPWVVRGGKRRSWTLELREVLR